MFGRPLAVTGEAGRCTIQTWSFGPTSTPATWPTIQLWGSGFGQNGSTRNCGRPAADSSAGTVVGASATAGVAEGTYLFAVPGSPGACRDAWDEILSTQLDYRHRPCNFVELMPRLSEHKRRKAG